MHTCICRNPFLSPPKACVGCFPGPDSKDAVVCHCVDLSNDMKYVSSFWINYGI